MALDEKIANEPLGEVTNGSLVASLAWTPVRSGSATLKIGSAQATFADDGQVRPSKGILNGSINYETGELAVALDHSLNGQSALIDYTFCHPKIPDTTPSSPRVNESAVRLVTGALHVGVMVNSIDWPKGEDRFHVFVSDKRSLTYVFVDGEPWVIEAWEGCEIARHNPRFLRTIFWSKPGA